MFKLLFIFMSLFILIGCGDDEVVIDETLPVTVHFAAEASVGDDGWQSFVTVTINSDGVVTQIELEGVGTLASASRRSISQGTTYEETFGYDFYEQITSLERSLRGVHSEDLVGAILDAYQNDSVDFNTITFAHLAELALASPPVERGQYMDGFYGSSSEINEDGYQYFVNLFVVHGDIIAVHWNAFNALDGAFKYTPSSTTVDTEILEWRNQAIIIEEALIQFQNPMSFSFDVDGFTNDLPGVYIEIESVVSLFTEALAAGPANPE